MKLGCLRKQDVLLCRRVSKPMKEVVDQQLLKKNPAWLFDKTYLLHPVQAENFMVRAREFINNGNASTLLSKSVQVSAGNYGIPIPMALNLLQVHGKWIRKLELTLHREGQYRYPHLWMEMLTTCFNHLPALEILELDLELERDFDDDDDEEEEEDEDEENVVDWNDFLPQIAHFISEHMTNLKELRLGTFYSAELVNKRVWQHFVFPKLKRLTLCTDNIRTFWENWYLLKKASFPKLKYLRVESFWGEQEEVGGWIPKLGNEEFDKLPKLKGVSAILLES